MKDLARLDCFKGFLAARAGVCDPEAEIDSIESETLSIEAS